jgi:adenylyltransferase/sulfurtransferase
LYSQHTTSTARSRRPAGVLIVGIGALGCAAADTLVRAGVRRLTIADFDTVERSNLQRQILFTERDIGRPKVAAARDALIRIAPHSRIETLELRLGHENVTDLIAEHEVMIDACDDADTKFALNSAAVRTGVPYSYGGVVGLRGQTMTIAPGVSACLACAFPSRDGGSTGNQSAGCAALGILPPVAGVIGSLQALSAERVLSGRIRPRFGRLIIFDLLRSNWTHVDFPRRHDCEACAAQTDLKRRVDACRS